MQVALGIVAFIIGWVLTKGLDLKASTGNGGESRFLGRLIGAGIIAALIYGGVMKLVGDEESSSEPIEQAPTENRATE